jgi:hypothetical protein
MSLPESYSRRRRTILPLFYQTFVLRLLSVVVQSVLPLYLVIRLGYAPATVGVMISLMWIGNALGGFAGTALTRGRRVVSALGFATLSVSLLGYSFGPSIPEAVPPLILLGGVGSGMVQPLLAPVMHTGSDSRRPFMGMSFYSTALSLGLISGPLLSAIAIANGGYTSLFALTFLVSVTGLASVTLTSIRSDANLDFQSFAGAVRLAMGSGLFRREFVLNLLYSLTLPLVLSFGSLVGEAVYGMSSSAVLTLFTGMFVLSGLLRFMTIGVSAVRFDRAMVIPVLFLLISSLLLSFGRTGLLFSAGLLLFAVPHALIYPWTLYNSFQSSGRETALPVSYIFSISSGLSEFISPPLASAVVLYFSVGDALLLLVPICLTALLWTLLTYLKGYGGIVRSI